MFRFSFRFPRSCIAQATLYGETMESNSRYCSSLPKHPPHLRGRAIGMFYAKKNAKRNQMREDKQRLAVHIDESKEERLSHFLGSIQGMNYMSSSSNNRDYDFKNEFWSSATEAEQNTLWPKYEVTSLQRIPHLDKQFYEELLRRKETAKFRSMLEEKRSSLPSFAMRESILRLVKENQVVVITGETGCGKTTQVPQYILDSLIESKNGSLCKIICTQPRRISAISVAERVAEERCVPCGKNSDVGYQIRLEWKLPRQLGSILFCTTGIMLQRLQSSPYLDGISHVIVDEVHERDLQSDFLLINLKDILTIRKDLKVILMSATMNAEEFSAYFGNCPMLEIPGFTYPVEEFTLEDMLEITHYRPMRQGTAKQQPKWLKNKRKHQEAFMKEQEREARFASYLRSLSDKYSASTIATLHTWDEENIDLDLIVEMLKYINLHKKEGAVLIFLPGWQQISKLNKLLTDSVFFSSSRFLIIPLHSLMPTLQQRDVFNKPPRGVQKIILATNIAETSITINDVVYVIDCGKIKMKSLDPVTNIQLLLPEWVALSNVKQRRGRAGRTQPGICYHMYTKFRASELDAYQLPEMLRSSLEELILNIKILKLGKVEPFLNKAMNPPNMNTVRMSLNTLYRLNALTADENLTPLGYHLARLPMDPHTGKMILLGAIFSCLDPILSVAASLSFRDAFVIPLGQEELVDRRKRELSENTQSDHLMFSRAIQLWERAKAHGSDGHFCWHNFLSASTLRMLTDLKRQYAQYLKGLCFLEYEDPKHPEYNRNSDNELLLKAIICAGLYPNVAKVRNGMTKPNSRRKRFLKAITEDGKKVSLHPKSVNAYEDYIKTGWLVYHLKIKSTEVYLHDTTAVTAYALLFFGGKLETSEIRGYETISVDDWIILQCTRNRAELVQDLRNELDGLLEHKIVNPGVSNWDPKTKEGLVLKCITELITSEETLTVAELESIDGPLNEEEDDLM